MARKFGSTYSPDGSNDGRPFRQARRSRAGGRVNLLFFAPLPLVFKAFGSEPLLLAGYLLAFGVLLLGAWLTREGLRAQDAYDARNVAKRPAFPRKLMGAMLIGIGLGLVGLVGHGAIEAAIFFVFGASLHILSFGIDPLRDKGVSGLDGFHNDRVAKAVEDAEKTLSEISSAIRLLNDRGLLEEVETFGESVRSMLRALESDPRDLTSARKYLSVYLRAARDAAVKFSDLYRRAGSDASRTEFIKLIRDLDRHFVDKTTGFLENDRIDLEVEISVLQDRLKAEGRPVTIIEQED